VFYETGYDKLVPPTWRYIIAGTLCSMPVLLVCVLICCFTNDYVDETEMEEY